MLIGVASFEILHSLFLVLYSIGLWISFNNCCRSHFLCILYQWVSHSSKLIVMKAKLLFPAILIFSIFISCNRADHAKESVADLKVLEPPKTTDAEKQQIPVGTIKQPFTDSTASPLQSAVTPNPDWDKKMIKTGTIKLEVKNFKNFSNNVHKIIKQFGGYIAQEEQNTTDGKTETAITIKVPVEQFENMINQLPGDEEKVLERKINTEDVTGDIVDTRSRLEAKKQMRTKYLEFLKQSKNMEEVLQVQNSVNNIQEEMESAAGRIQSLSHQSAYSTINLSFYEPVSGYTAPDENPSFLTRISNAFKTGGSWIADLGLGVDWGGFGVYVGKAVTSGEPVRFSLRLDHRF